MNGNEKNQSAWKMLSPPRNGWANFWLDGFRYTYRVSDAAGEDIAFEWIDHAICGLETLSPFCVKGWLEAPGRMICVVNTRNCRVLVEPDDLSPQWAEVSIEGYSPTTMVEFCRYLYEDISAHIDSWVDWLPFGDREEKKKVLLGKLARLKEHTEFYGDELF